jgi:SAM-dependent methyltransferase
MDPKNKAVVDQVPTERWQAAQAWEKAHWDNTQRLRAKFGKNLVWRLLRLFGAVPRYRGTDYNEWWKERFEDYRFLPSHLEQAIEVGCGPYTNVRLMLERTRFDHLVLSDPLIRSYARYDLTLVSELARDPRCTLDDHPLEELPFNDHRFDLAVMINVLDHVRDARACMRNLLRVLKPGGIVIIGQELTSADDLARIDADPGRIGHPVTLDADWFAPFLKPAFAPIIDRVLARHEGRGDYHCGTLVFAGRKDP